jgi:hypothetical protein
MKGTGAAVPVRCRRRDSPKKDLVSQETVIPTVQPEPARERPAHSLRSSFLLSEILDSVSFAFFCFSFSSLAHWFRSWCYRLMD